MIVEKRSLILAFGMIIAVAANIMVGDSVKVMASVSLITIVIASYYNLKVDDNRLSYSSVVLIYTIATQFGLVLPYVFVGRSVVSHYADWTLSFLNSNYLGYALFIGNLAVLMFCVGKAIAINHDSMNSISQEKLELYDNFEIENRTYIVGIIMMLGVILYFSYHILTGGTVLFSSYSVFMNSSAYRNSMYTYVLIAFYVATVYIAAAGEAKKHKFGWILWAIVVIFFAMNGNKGEFMYSLLAVMGMKGLEGRRITFRVLVPMMLIVFVVIPTISNLRGIGLVGNLNAASFSFFDAFAEMGMQIRTTIYSLEDLRQGNLHYLYGASYIRPFLNFIPFLHGPVATAEFRAMYPGYGFNQVIESYANFGVFGVMSFFALLGYLLSVFERKVENRLKLAYLGTITCIIINASRNYFAFVPGQIVIVTAIYILITKVRVNRG